jgi:RNA polymerase sigma-70 factor (ECF subfamily)
LDENAVDNPIRLALAVDDPVAVELIWDRYASDLLAYLQAVLCSRIDAEETLQEVFIRLVRKRWHLAKARNLRAYLFQIARHEAATYARRRRRQPVDAASWLVAAEGIAADQDLADDLAEALGGLPQEQRTVIVMKVYQDQTFQEISAVLGISPNTAASRYRYGMEKLRTLLRSYRR